MSYELRLICNFKTIFNIKNSADDISAEFLFITE